MSLLVASSHHSHPGPQDPHRFLAPNAQAMDSTGERELILVVDDEPNIVDFLSLLLEEEGYRVRQAANGREALAAIEDERPRLVISDVMMPGITGVELVRHLGHAERQPQPKVILMSAVAHRAPATGVPFIQKPFDIEDMLDLVDHALEPESQRSA